MKFTFKIQQYQTDAVDAVARVFQGQPYNAGVSYLRDIGDGVQNFYLITIFQHGLPTFKHDCTFRIGYDIGTMALQEVRFQPKSRFARAGAADHQHVFVPGVLGVRWTIAHH